MKARPVGWSVIALGALFVGTAAAAPPPHAGGGKGGPPAHAGGGNGKGGGAHGKSDHSKSDRGPSDRGGRDEARHGEIRVHDDHRLTRRDPYSNPCRTEERHVGTERARQVRTRSTTSHHKPKKQHNSPTKKSPP